VCCEQLQLKGAPGWLCGSAHSLALVLNWVTSARSFLSMARRTTVLTPCPGAAIGLEILAAVAFAGAF
jgi:hypothetical protein